MSMLLLNVLLAIAWMALNGRFTPVDMLFGYVLGFVLMWVISRGWSSQGYFKQIPRAIKLSLYFLRDLIKANLRLASIILSPRMNLRPAVIAFPLDLKSEAGIILLANLISLTPGTLSLDISTDWKILYIHSVWLEDAEKFKQGIKQGYERLVRELVET